MSIEVQGISKIFKGRRKGDEENVVLKDVSFKVEEGEFVSLLGPSGCGKTTTLTIIAGFQKANEGKIIVNGKEVTKPGTDRSFMFQNYALFPWMKVGENIEYPMKKKKLPKAERKEKLKEDYNKAKFMLQMQTNYTEVIDSLISALDGVMYDNNNILEFQVKYNNSEDIENMFNSELFFGPEYYDINITSYK